MSKPEHHDVIVIGAGIAGLRCAHDLVHAKGATDVLVVDAMDRVGGRILADREFIPGMTVEVGAEFMHGANTSLTRLAEQQHWAVREIFTWAQVRSSCCALGGSTSSRGGSDCGAAACACMLVYHHVRFLGFTPTASINQPLIREPRLAIDNLLAFIRMQ